MCISVLVYMRDQDGVHKYKSNGDEQEPYVGYIPFTLIDKFELFFFLFVNTFFKQLTCTFYHVN